MELERSTYNQGIPIVETNDATTENDETNVDLNVTAPVRVNHVQHQEIPVSKNVQSDLDLWARIREYDKRMAEEGFTQVLTKKQ